MIGVRAGTILVLSYHSLLAMLICLFANRDDNFLPINRPYGHQIVTEPKEEFLYDPYNYYLVKI